MTVLILAASLVLAGCATPNVNSSAPKAISERPATTEAPPVSSAPLPPVDLAPVHAAFTKSGAPGAPGPMVAAASYLRAVAHGDAKRYFEVTGSHVTADELTALRQTVFHRALTFTVGDVWNNQGTSDGKGLIVRAVPETAAGLLLETTLRVNSVDGAWFVSQAAGTGQPPLGQVRELVEAEVRRTLQADTDGPTAYAKPVIYLYPTRTTRVHVRLDVSGTITASEPAYDPAVHGWNVIAAPDGLLTDPATGRTWPYLFWEADARLASGVEGSVVAGRDTGPFLEKKLAELGLNAGERAAFIEYWSPRMSLNRFNLVRFEGAAYEASARLTVTPRPDTIIRVFMTFMPLGFPVKVEPQHMAPPPARHGFTVVEWGGREVPAQ
jgi:hypothetical protein